MLPHDDLFDYAPSFFMDGLVVEGKAIGTAPELDLVMLDKDRTLDTIIRPDALAQDRKTGVTVGRRQLDATQALVAKETVRHLDAFLAGTLDAKALQKAMVKTMKSAWRTVFIAGVRASGVASAGSKAKNAKWQLSLSPADEKWFKSAVQHEMRFLNRFVQAVVTGDYVMPLAQRAKMYADALSSFYESARVIGLPALSVIIWRLKKNDKVVCASCRYLAAWSPWTKRLLATTPRSGMTVCLCLTNSRVSISTTRGKVAWEDVCVGDTVLAHDGTLTRVHAKTVNYSTPQHRFAVVVGEGGKLFGVTDEHLVWTELGWLEARQAALADVRVLRQSCRRSEQDGSLSFLRSEGTVEGCAREGEAGSGVRWAPEATHALRGLDREFISPAALGRALDGTLLEGGDEALRVSLPLALGASTWSDPAGCGGASSEWRFGGRPAVESGADAQQLSAYGDVSSRGGAQAVCDTRAAALCALRRRVHDAGVTDPQWAREILFAVVPTRRADGPGAFDLPTMRDAVRPGTLGALEGSGCSEFLLGELLQRSAEAVDADPVLRLLSDEVHAAALSDARVQTGQVLLLSGLLPEGTPLYDLTTGAQSFVAEGVFVHNTNCRCRLLIRKVTPKRIQEIEDAHRYTRGGHIKNLREIKRLGQLPARLEAHLPVLAGP